jgi:hypothetical protein
VSSGTAVALGTAGWLTAVVGWSSADDRSDPDVLVAAGGSVGVGLAIAAAPTPAPARTAALTTAMEERRVQLMMVSSVGGTRPSRLTTTVLPRL